MNGLPAWVELDRTEHDAVWTRLTDQLDFRPGVDPKRWPSFGEPHDSITWSLPRNADEHHVESLLLSALSHLVAADQFVYALDWQHPGYRFFPARAEPSGELERWPVPALPDGDYYLFVDRHFRFGWLTHPWEGSVCAHGALAAELAEKLSDWGWPVIRRGGRRVRRRG